VAVARSDARSGDTPIADSTDAGEVTEGLFTLREVARLFSLPEQRLRYWSQTGFVAPSVRNGGRIFYSFRDLIAVRVAKGLLDCGMPLRRVRRQLAALRRSLPDVDAPLSDLRIRCEDDRVVVHDGTRRFEATGQLVLDFDVEGLRRHVAEVHALPWVEEGLSLADLADHEPRTAYDWFLYACELEQEWGGAPADTAGFAAAREAYETALDLDPVLAAAWTNLGSMLAEVGDLDAAQTHYEEALRHDPDQPEAHCNLAELALRRGDPEAAISAYRYLLRNHPDHFEAHYGLARALLEVGGKVQALAHLQRFCRAVDAIASELRDAGLQERRDGAWAFVRDLRTELDAE
jgi:tetratricopeptide (TPR) repeat protein